MKSILVLTLLTLCFLSAYSQSKDSTRFVLAVEKEFKNHNKTFIFKPNGHLKIRTESGKTYSSNKYSSSDKFILMDKKDTIHFEDIKWIKGRVYGNKGRKIAGAVIATYAVIAGSAAIYGMLVVGGPLGSVSVLAAGTVYVGIRLMGARKFWKMYHCTIVRISPGAE